MTATLEALHVRLTEAGNDFADAIYRMRDASDPESMPDDLIEDLIDTEARFAFISVLHEAEAIQCGDAEGWSDGLEARAYLAALRKLTTHLELVTGGNL